jgi:hypothetical protein
MTREENQRLQSLFDDGMAMLTCKVETLSKALYDEVHNLKKYAKAATSLNGNADQVCVLTAAST